jgi:hypothetical protein
MTSNVSNQVPFLRTTRTFPEEAQPLSVELTRSYLDIAEKVNDRTIGIFATNKPIVTGESWFLNTGKKQQTLRQIYPITSAAAFNHNINFQNVTTFTVIRGIGFDGTNYYPIPFVSSSTVAANIGIIVTPTQVVISPGGSAPAIVSAVIVLEWLSQS